VSGRFPARGSSGVSTSPSTTTLHGQRPTDQRAEIQWATAIHRNLVAHAGIPAAPNFLLVGYPDAFFVWVASTRSDFARSPDYVYFTPAVLRPYRDSVEADERPHERERVVALWLEDLLRGGSDVRRERSVDASDALNALLLDIVRGGTVVRQAPAAA
jgi:hypothetical protein